MGLGAGPLLGRYWAVNGLLVGRYWLLFLGRYWALIVPRCLFSGPLLGWYWAVVGFRYWAVMGWFWAAVGLLYWAAIAMGLFRPLLGLTVGLGIGPLMRSDIGLLLCVVTGCHYAFWWTAIIGTLLGCDWAVTGCLGDIVGRYQAFDMLFIRLPLVAHLRLFIWSTSRFYFILFFLTFKELFYRIEVVFILAEGDRNIFLISK